ncbi:hypothetical protein HDU76_012876 [Blyttiomyces sp. JEL0837]|nr:hypothetical protein HDU76_012876 [Blyttiomyces sp. JEL0837]
MEDDELAAIRAKRMAEMRGSSGGGSEMRLPAGLTAASAPGAEGDQGEKRAQMEEMRRAMTMMQGSDMMQCLCYHIAVARISIVKSDKARAVEDLLIRMVRFPLISV